MNLNTAILLTLELSFNFHTKNFSRSSLIFKSNLTFFLKNILEGRVCGVIKLSNPLQKCFRLL